MATSSRAEQAPVILKATPDTVHWGYLDATIKPVLTIDSGDWVTIECATCNPEWMPPKESEFDILPDIASSLLPGSIGLPQCPEISPRALPTSAPDGTVAGPAA